MSGFESQWGLHSRELEDCKKKKKERERETPFLKGANTILHASGPSTEEGI